MAVVGSRGQAVDYLLLTHYHVDHIGGMQESRSGIPIRHYVGHGPSIEEREQVGVPAGYAELYGKA